MLIINASVLYPRYFHSRLVEALAGSSAVLYTDGTVAGFGEGLYAVPITYLWKGQG